MYVSSVRITFRVPYAASLKDKRQVRRSLIDKALNKFNASVAEVDTQDIIQTLTIGVAVVSGGAAHAQNSLEEIIRFMESNGDADLIRTEFT